MENTILPTIEQHFGDLTDPRIDRTKLHELMNILVIAICGVIAGADGWEDVEEFGKARLEWLQTFLEIPNGIPSHDTFTRVFARLDPEQFQTCFMHWMRAVAEVLGGQLIAVDGKVLRRSHDRGIGKAAIDMVSAWATDNRLVLGQVKVDEKSNEIMAILQLLGVLEVAGCIVTIDALGCQTEIAEKIIQQEAEYVLSLKENQGHLYEDVEHLFADLEDSHYQAYEYDYEKTVNKDHGRIEIRECWTISDPEVLRHLRGFENTKVRVSPDGVQAPPPEAEITESYGWEYYPDVLENSIRYVSSKISVPILVTENGIATSDDARRITWIKHALKGLKSCLEDNIYLYWSAMDNFEWLEGYGPKFGLLAVNREDQSRTVKESAVYLGEVARTNAIET